MTQHKIYDDKSKHIHRRHTIPLNNLSLIEFYVKSKDNIADPLIKDLSREQFYKFLKEMRLKPIVK